MRQLHLILAGWSAVNCCGCMTAPPVSKIDYSQVSGEEIALNAAAGNTQIPPQSISNNKLTPAAFAKVGYGVVEDQCQNYFDAIAKTDNGIKMTKADVVAAGTAAAVIATLAKSTAKGIGITAAGFGLVGSTIDNYEQYAFATPYPLQTYALVSKALSAYEKASPSSSAQTLEDAAALIRGYAQICSYVGIATLSEQAISKASPGDTSKPTGPLFSADDKKTYLHPIDSDLGVMDDTLTDNDYVVLAAIADPSVTDLPTLSKLTATFSDSVSGPVQTTKIFDGTTKQSALTPIWALLKPLMAENSTFAGDVKDAQTTAAGGTTPTAKPVHKAKIAIM